MGCSKTWVAISADTTRDYAFLIPLAALFWKELIGFEPICQLVGDWCTDKRAAISREAIVELGVRVQHIGRVDGYLSSTIAENVREHAAADPALGDDDWFLPSDADLWPLKADYYRTHLNYPQGPWAVLLNGYGDGFEGKESFLEKATRLIRGQTIPTCHVVMKVRTWRTLYGLTAGDDIATATKRTMDWWIIPRVAGKSKMDAGFIAWMSDQDVLTYKLASQDWFPEGVVWVPRRGSPPVDRLCRSVPEVWGNKDYVRFTDVHCWKAPDSDDHWAMLRDIIACFLPRRLAWADDYRTRFYGSYHHA